MNIVKKIQSINLPVVGILAFSLCSVNSIYHLLAGSALNPSPVLYFPAVLVELVTAWAVYQVVETMRKLTKSRISKQDRRFHLGILAAFVAVSLPLVGTSVWANYIEFGGSVALGALFPVASIGCAIGAALPQIAVKYEKGKETLAKAQADERKRKAKEKARKVAESERQAQASQAQADESRAQSERKLLASLGKAGATLEQYIGNPRATQESVAQELGITRQAVGQHLRKLEQAGVIERSNGAGVELVTQ